MTGSVETAEAAALPTVSVVIPTFDRKGFLTRVVTPLLADPAATEVIVVVDGSTDGSYELLTEIASRDSRLKPLLIENRGQTGAQQLGLEMATGEVVLLLDDDVVSAPGLITGHARNHAASKGLVVVGYMPTLVPTERDASTFSTVLYAREYERSSRRSLEAPDEILSGLWMGNISLRQEDVTRIGLFNPKYGSITDFYHVDRDFGLRCLKGGLRGVHDRELRAEHIHARSLSAFLRDARRQGVGRVGLHDLHLDVLGPITLDYFSEGLPGPARALVRSAGRPAVRAPVVALLSGWIRLAGALRLTVLQLPAAQLARRIEQQRGAIEAIRRGPLR